MDQPANNPKYYSSDYLKSTDIVTNSTAGILRESDYTPYGSEVVVSGTDPNHYKFTGKERDPESGLDDFDARFYSSPFGRFMQPDWAAKPADVPYANFGNPQSLNLYGYVVNNPTTTRDLDGQLLMNAASEGGYKTIVNLQCAGLPAQVSCQFWPPNLIVSAGGISQFYFYLAVGAALQVGPTRQASKRAMEYLLQPLIPLLSMCLPMGRPRQHSH